MDIYDIISYIGQVTALFFFLSPISQLNKLRKGIL